MRLWTTTWLLALLSLSLLPQPAFAAPGDVEWTRRFEIGIVTDVTAVATHPSGVYAVGTSKAEGGRVTAFVRAYDSNGRLRWSGWFSGPQEYDAYASADDVAVDDTGVYVAGTVSRCASGDYPNFDAFVRKYTHQGKLLWTRFITGNSEACPDYESFDQARGIAVDATGVYVVGETDGSVSGQDSSISSGIFLRKYTHGGKVAWTRQHATSNCVGCDFASDITLDPWGVIVAGTTSETWPGQTKTGSLDGYVRKYSRWGRLYWTRQFGVPDQGETYAQAVTAEGASLYVGGYTYGDLAKGTSGSSGDSSAFVRKYRGDGTLRWTRQFGSDGGSAVEGLDADTGRVYVAGKTWGALPEFTDGDGQESDAFVTSFSSTGTRGWTRQFGTKRLDWAKGIALGPPPNDTQQDSRLGLYVGGAFYGDDASGGREAFVRKYEE